MNGQPHWVLDTFFNEDSCRVRKDNGAQNLNLIRKIVMSLLKSMELSEIFPTKKSHYRQQTDSLLKSARCLLNLLQNYNAVALGVIMHLNKATLLVV